MSQPAPPPRPGPPPPFGQGPPYPPHPQYPNQPPQQFYQPQPSPETRKDVAAAWAARLELGMDFEEHIAAGLAQRVEELAALRAGELRYQAEAARGLESSEQSGKARRTAPRDHSNRQFRSLWRYEWFQRAEIELSPY